MAKIMITWHTMHDNRVCKICQNIDNYTWIYDTRSGPLMTNQLDHPQYGVVWDKVRGSAAHTHGSHGMCRCNLSCDIEISDLIVKAQDLLRAVQEAAAKP